jgi:hypothetical protein
MLAPGIDLAPQENFVTPPALLDAAQFAALLLDARGRSSCGQCAELPRRSASTVGAVVGQGVIKPEKVLRGSDLGGRRQVDRRASVHTRDFECDRAGR